MSIGKISVTALIASLLWTVIILHLKSIDQGNLSHDEGWRIFGDYILLYCFSLGLTVLNIVLLAITLIDFCKVSRLNTKKSHLFKNALLNVSCLLTLWVLPNFCPEAIQTMGLVETVNGKTVTRRVPVGQAIEEMQASWYETEFILAPHFVFDDANWKDKVTFQQPWRFSFNKVENPNDTSRPALRLSDGTHNICSFSFELFISKDISGQFATQNEINLSTKKLMEEYTGKSQENAVCNLQPKNGKGAYCIFTNVNLTMISMGIVKIDDYIFKVRGYYDANGKTDFKDFLTVLESLKIEKR